MHLKEYLAANRGNGKFRTLATLLEVSPSFLSQMAHGKTAISTKRAVEIERHTGGAVTRKDLFPQDWQDIWPELTTME